MLGTLSGWRCWYLVGRNQDAAIHAAVHTTGSPTENDLVPVLAVLRLRHLALAALIQLGHNSLSATLSSHGGMGTHVCAGSPNIQCSSTFLRKVVCDVFRPGRGRRHSFVCRWPSSHQVNSRLLFGFWSCRDPLGLLSSHRCGARMALSHGASAAPSSHSAKRPHSRPLLCALGQRPLAASCQSVFTGEHLVFEGATNLKKIQPNTLRHVQQGVHTPEAARQSPTCSASGAGSPR